MSNKERKRELLTFLLAKPKDQSALFRAIINKDLAKMKEHIDARSKDEELQKYNKQLDHLIYKNKLDGIEQQTKILKEQMEAQANGIEYPSIMSILDRKLFIIEMQLSVGVYNLINNTSVKFYFDI
jgi:hypothetical protein